MCANKEICESGTMCRGTWNDSSDDACLRVSVNVVPELPSFKTAGATGLYCEIVEDTPNNHSPSSTARSRRNGFRGVIVLTLTVFGTALAGIYVWRNQPEWMYCTHTPHLSSPRQLPIPNLATDSATPSPGPVAEGHPDKASCIRMSHSMVYDPMIRFQ